MNEEQERAREVARRLILGGVPAWAITWSREGLPSFTGEGPEVSTCGWFGGRIAASGRACERPAGRGTEHPGIGKCFVHERSSGSRAEGAWLVAHVIAVELDVDPMHGLLIAVRRAAAWSGFYHKKMGEARSDDDLAPGGSHRHWVEDAERSTAALARYSQMAVSAGIAAMLVQRAQVEGEQIAQALNQAIGAVGLDVELESRLRSALRDALSAMDSPTPQPVPAIEAGPASTP